MPPVTGKPAGAGAQSEIDETPSTNEILRSGGRRTDVNLPAGPQHPEAQPPFSSPNFCVTVKTATLG